MTILKLARLRWHAAGCLFFVFLFQASYSLGPVYLSHAVTASKDRASILDAITIFLVLYLVPYPLSYVAHYLKVFWKTGARQAFYRAVYAATAGRVFLFANPNAETSFAALVSANGQELVADSVEFIYGTASLLFSSVLSVLLISTFVLEDFALAYLATGILCALTVWLSRSWQMNLMARAEKAYHRMISAFPEGWHANVLGETAITAQFMRIFDRLWRHYQKISVWSKVCFQAYDMVLTLWIWGPTVTLILWRLQTMDVTAMIGLAIILPRLTETLLDISNLLSNVTDFLALRGRVTWLNDALERDPNVDILSRINISEMQFARKVGDQWLYRELSSLDEAIQFASGPGRYSVKGHNGVGKSSLLLLLKAKAGEEALYLPAQALLFPNIGKRLSTGQHKLRDLNNSIYSARGKIKFILLDEWDANLDLKKRQEISSFLDQLALSHVIIETSHHSSSVSSESDFTS